MQLVLTNKIVQKENDMLFEEVTKWRTKSEELGRRLTYEATRNRDLTFQKESLAEHLRKSFVEVNGLRIKLDRLKRRRSKK